MERRNGCDCHVHDGSRDLVENDSGSYCPYVDLLVLPGCFPESHMLWTRRFLCSLVPEGTGAHPRCSEM